MNYTSKGMIQKVLFILKKCCHFLSKCDIIQKNVEEVLLVLQVKKLVLDIFHLTHGKSKELVVISLHF